MFQGIFTPMVTIFDENEKLDFEGNRRLINKLIHGGVDGIVFLGSIGEFFTLSVEEKKEFIDFSVKEVQGKTKVLIGTGGTNVDEVIQLTQYAEKSGADAALVITPYYFKLDDESLYRYYAAVASSVKMPIVLYNFPDRTAVNLSPQLVLRLATAYKNIVGIKDTVDTISHTRELIQKIKPIRKDFSILSGFDEYFLPNLIAGGDGFIGGLTNIAPEIFVALYKAFQAQDFKQICILQKKVNRLMDIYGVSQPFILAIKSASTILLEHTSSMARRPAGKLGETQIDTINKILTDVEPLG